MRIAFGISPFTSKEELERAVATEGPPHWGARGAALEVRRPSVVAAGRSTPHGPRDSADSRGARCDAVCGRKRVWPVGTIPGTKCIELAALGVPSIVCTPLNFPEGVVINGPLQYVGRIPAIGAPLKRAAVVALNKRFPLAAQPNIDAGEMLMPELRGTLTPGRIASVVADYAADENARQGASERLRSLYAAHVGASHRMACSLLER